MTSQATDEAAIELHIKLDGCPICGSPPRRERRKSGAGSVVCYAGSHSLRVNADSQRQADRRWNNMAADWAKRQDAGSQIALSLRVTEAISSMEHAARIYDNGLNSRAASLRIAARTLIAALTAERQRAERAEKALKDEITDDMVWAAVAMAVFDDQLQG